MPLLTSGTDEMPAVSLFLSACLFLFLSSRCHSGTAITRHPSPTQLFPSHSIIDWKPYPHHCLPFSHFLAPCQLSLPSLLLPQCSCGLHINLQVQCPPAHPQSATYPCSPGGGTSGTALPRTLVPTARKKRTSWKLQQRTRRCCGSSLPSPVSSTGSSPIRINSKKAGTFVIKNKKKWYGRFVRYQIQKPKILRVRREIGRASSPCFEYIALD